MSDLLDLHLSRSIERLKPMSKFSEVADRMKRQRLALEARADDLMTKMDGVDSKADEIFAKHEATLKAAEVGFKEMEDALRDLAGGNSPPTEAESKGGDELAKPFLGVGPSSLGTG